MKRRDASSRRWAARALVPTGALALTILGMAASPALAQSPPITQPGGIRRTTQIPVPGTMGIPQPEPNITLNIQKRPLGRILAEIFKQTPFQFRLLASQGTTLFSLEANREPFRKVLTRLLEQDKSAEPLVFGFDRTTTGQGIVTIDRELVDIAVREGEKYVSLTNARLTTVLTELFKRANVKYRIEPDVSPVPISLQLRPLEWLDAIPTVILEAFRNEPALTFSQDRDTWVVHLQKLSVDAETPTEKMPRRKFQVTAAPLRDALATLFTGSSFKYQVAESVKDTTVTYSTQGETDIAILQRLLRQAAGKGNSVTWREGNGMLFIEPGPLPGEAPQQTARTSSVQEPTTSLNLTDNIRALATLLAQATQTTVTVSPNVPNLRVMLKVENATIDQALEALVAAARGSVPNLSFRKSGKRYILELVQGNM